MLRRRRPLRLFAFGGPARSFEYAEKRVNDDGTVDLIGVEILSAGGPVHGIGSPPQGDFWKVDELEGMAVADRELGDELLPPNKIGHPDEQVLVANSIDAGELPSDGEMPAVGWLEDLRVEGEKLLADVKKVPKLVVDAIDKGAYRTRSTELAKVTSQKTGKTYDWVVTGLAWLGGKMPAVRTLGDVVALYEGDVPVRRVAVVFEERALAEGEIAWSPDEGLESLRAKVNDALNPGPYSAETSARYWVRDVAPGKALVEDWAEEAGTAYVVGFAIESGEARLDPSSDWTKAEQAWVETARSNSARLLTLRDPAADTRAMKFTAEQRRTFAEATGLKEEDVTDEILEKAGVKNEEETSPEPKPDDPPPPAPQDDPEAEEGEPEGEPRENSTSARVTALETQLHQERRRNFVETEAIHTGKIEPGQRETLETLFDKDEAAARAFVAGLQPREDLLEELGSEGDDDEDGGRAFAASDAYKDSAADRFGFDKEGVV